MWGSVGKRGEAWGDGGYVGEMWGDVGRCGEIWGGACLLERHRAWQRWRRLRLPSRRRRLGGRRRRSCLGLQGVVAGARGGGGPLGAYARLVERALQRLAGVRG